MRSAASLPATSAATDSAKSMPAVTPAPVKTLPSRTTRASACTAPTSGNRSVRPVRGGAAAPQQPGYSQNERSCADRRDIRRPRRLPAHEIDCVCVGDGARDAEPTWHAEKVERLRKLQSWSWAPGSDRNRWRGLERLGGDVRSGVGSDAAPARDLSSEAASHWESTKPMLKTMGAPSGSVGPSDSVRRRLQRLALGNARDVEALEVAVARVELEAYPDE